MQQKKSDVDECALDLCKEPNSWCINLRGSFACCTANSTSSTCVGLEITGGQEGHLHAASAGILRTQYGSLASSSPIATKDIGSSGKIVSNTFGTSKARTGQDAGADAWGHWSSGSSGRKGGWAIETVGEWKNFTGHAIIIGRGRIESGKWNLTQGMDGKLTWTGFFLLNDKG
ncbi:unnamed protein product [Gongylonema pulchrum]|uniref:EGF_CA domain-containing protein n=1 Tax=Gongylonema pulchrum TaxID=637853 RepID=A0A183DTH3_9BILA|nr:unnamed protein product [Gongylonema pulchrum]